MHIFRLTILSSSKSQATVIASFRGTQTVERVQVTDDTVEFISSRVKEIRSALRTKRVGVDPAPLRGEMKALGKRLFETFLSGQVGVYFRQASGGRGVPVEVIAEDPERALWPWELLFDPSSNWFVAQQSHPISRGVFSQCPCIDRETRERPARLLILIAAQDSGRKADAQVAYIKEALRNDRVQLEALYLPTLFQLDEGLNRFSPDIVHFYGHAESHSVYLAQREGERISVGPENFARILTNKGAFVKLVVLMGCETGRASHGEHPGFHSVAGALVQRGIPCVVASQFEIPDSAAHAFSRTLYSALGYGKPLTEAVSQARNCHHAPSDPAAEFDWCVPVVYAREPALVFPGLITAGDGTLNSDLVARGLHDESQHGCGRTPSATVLESLTKVAVYDINSGIPGLLAFIKLVNDVQSKFEFSLSYPARVPSLSSLQGDTDGRLTVTVTRDWSNCPRSAESTESSPKRFLAVSAPDLDWCIGRTHESPAKALMFLIVGWLMFKESFDRTYFETDQSRDEIARKLRTLAEENNTVAVLLDAEIELGRSVSDSMEVYRDWGEFEFLGSTRLSLLEERGIRDQDKLVSLAQEDLYALERALELTSNEREKVSSLVDALSPSESVGEFTTPKVDLTIAAEPELRLSRTHDLSGFEGHDLDGLLPPIRDQGSRATCTAFAVVRCLEISWMKRTDLSPATVDLSEEFVYWTTKDIDDALDTEGSWLRCAAEAVVEFGACSETMWPYLAPQDSPSGRSPKPPQRCFEEATVWRPEKALVLDPADISRLIELLSQDIPVAYAFPIYRSCLLSRAVRRDGYLTLPLLPFDSLVGGQAVTLSGFEVDESHPGGGYFVFDNSWGTSWGDANPYGAGRGILPFKFAEIYGREAVTFEL